ncbi:MAG: hypothetical protein PHV57_08410, partial [Methanomicrobiaceae archaeon]|nr:hypothetical protein [Methanomicrobiaceae archaeon]
GKTGFGASFVHAARLRGERCLYFSFEESPDQVVMAPDACQAAAAAALRKPIGTSRTRTASDGSWHPEGGVINTAIG